MDKVSRFFYASILCQLVSVSTVWAQSAGEAGRQPAFDVASVKRSLPGSLPSGWQTSAAFQNVRVQGREHGRHTVYHSFLKTYLQAAYRLPPDRIEAPGWTESERYDIVATMPPDTPDNQVLAMRKNLLIERFQMKLRLEQRVTPVYALVVGKSGPKLKATVEGTTREVRLGDRTMVAKNQSINNLANILTLWSDRPVVDMTELQGSYDFTLDWRGGGDGRAEAAASSVSGKALALAGSDPLAPFDALPSLGLKTEKRTMPMEFLIVEHAERIPTEN